MEDELLQKLRDNELYKIALQSANESDAKQISSLIESFVRSFAADLAPFIEAVAANSGSLT